MQMLSRNILSNHLTCLPRSSGYSGPQQSGIEICVSDWHLLVWSIQIMHMECTYNLSVEQLQCGSCSFWLVDGELRRSKCNETTCIGNLPLSQKGITSIKQGALANMSYVTSLWVHLILSAHQAASVYLCLLNLFLAADISIAIRSQHLLPGCLKA